MATAEKEKRKLAAMWLTAAAAAAARRRRRGGDEGGSVVSRCPAGGTWCGSGRPLKPDLDFIRLATLISGVYIF